MMKTIIAFIMFILSFGQMVPYNYQSIVYTDGETEAYYLKNGQYKVKHYEKHINDESFNKIAVYYPSELKNSNTKYPVVFFLNGTDLPCYRYKKLFKHMASWGVIVVGNDDRNTASGKSTENSLSYLIEQNRNENSVFYNKIDFENMGLLGYSQGGAGAINAMTVQPHGNLYKTAVLLSPINDEEAPKINMGYDLEKVSVPILMIAGTVGDFEVNYVLPFEIMKKMYDKLKVPKVMMRKKDVDHGFILCAADGYVTAWLMWYLKNDNFAKSAFVGNNAEIYNNDAYQDVKADL